MNQPLDRGSRTAGPSHRSPLWGTILLAVFPALLIGAYYYGPVLAGSKGVRGGSDDAAFYTVQTWRVGARLGGQWWRQIEPIGPRQPYPPDTTRLPHVFEGTDLMLLSVVTSAFLPRVPDLQSEISNLRLETADSRAGVLRGGLAAPIVNFNVLSILVLLTNGWVAGWFVRRHSESLGYAVLAQVLVTLNWSTASAFNGHLHLYKHFWVLLAACTGFAFWERPTLGRAALFGLCFGLLVQGSWHFGYLMLAPLGALFAAAALRGTVRREHLRGLVSAGLVATVVAGAAIAPYWLAREGAQEQFTKRDLRDLFRFGSELCEYVIPPWSRVGELYQQARLRYSPLAGTEGETWHYPGAVVLIALGAYLVWLLRPTGATDCQRRRMDFLVLLSGLLVLESLSGGVSVLLYKVAPMFRAYGRAGAMAVGLWAVSTPLLLHQWSRRLPSPSWRGALLAGCLAIALAEGWFCRRALRLPEPDAAVNLPPWVAWLAGRPLSEQAAVLPVVIDEHQQSYWALFHRHAVLNTCDVRFFHRDVVEAGGKTGEAISPHMIDVLRRRGYAIVILRRMLWRDYPWLEQRDDWELIEDGDDWRAYRLHQQTGDADRMHEPKKASRSLSHELQDTGG